MYYDSNNQLAAVSKDIEDSLSRKKTKNQSAKKYFVSH